MVYVCIDNYFFLNCVQNIIVRVLQENAVANGGIIRFKIPFISQKCS